ncbi:JNK1/MAPK8-associated membrane protein isoform X2 [Eupeodes corollae]|uniref:JNK1/MAPK8-associated membrane protein isoform X2 n=1 Tax=Eupeodes corollae TaxID=290404 RepID=UPI002493B1D5|nr:JNK1/MAPK8-associated membrane protein isoform X2 [Eupeodes corollae]
MSEICPGRYCGRTEDVNGISSSCGPCPIGYRVNEQRECVRCVRDPSHYDLLYLGFMFMLPFIMHFYVINRCCDSLKDQITTYSSAVVELVLSALISVLLMDPVGTFHLHTCGVEHFSDWYTLFYNPSPNYVSKLHCTQEAVYPLQTMVLVFYFISLLQMIVFRLILKTFFWVYKDRALYSAMYFFPILMFGHSVACGILCGHWFFLAYGIISLRHTFFLFLVPIPFFFYNLTLPYTDPSEFQENEE